MPYRDWGWMKFFDTMEDVEGYMQAHPEKKFIFLTRR